MTSISDKVKRNNNGRRDNHSHGTNGEELAGVLGNPSKGL